MAIWNVIFKVIITTIYILGYVVIDGSELQRKTQLVIKGMLFCLMFCLLTIVDLIARIMM